MATTVTWEVHLCFVPSSHIDKEKEANLSKSTNNTFWQQKYRHIADNKCTFCKNEPETIDHLLTCKDSRVEEINHTAHLKVTKLLRSTKVWYHCPSVPTTHKLSVIKATTGSKGVIPKEALAHIKLDVEAKQLGKNLLKAQTIIVKAALNIWKKRNQILFGT